MRRLWTIDSLDRRILAISIPALGSLLVEPIYVLTDTAVVGQLGTASLGGLALASTVLNTLVWVFNFLSYSTTVRVEDGSLVDAGHMPHPDGDTV